jgi:phage gp29-like protein
MANPRIYAQPPIQSPTTWTIARVLSAIDLHEVGDFCESSLLADAFGRDDRISACEEARLNALVGMDAGEFELRPVEGKWARRSKALIPQLEEWWDDVVTDAWVKKTLLDGIRLGVSLTHIEWKRTARRWVPAKLTHWHASNFRWSEQDQRYLAHTTDGEIIIEPDDPNWFIYTPGGERSWMCGDVRCLGVPYVMRQWDLRDWARFNERHGQPILAIHEPSSQGPAGHKDAFFAGMKTMGRSGIVRLPFAEKHEDGYGLDLVESKSRGADTFDTFLDRLNIAIAIRINGQNLTTEIQGGSYSAAGWHMRVRRDYAEGDAATLGAAERDQLVRRWGRFNVPGWDDVMAPVPAWDLQIPEDQGATAETFLKGAQAAQAFKDAGIRIDVAAMMERLGVPMLAGEPTEEVEEPDEPEPGAPPPGEPQPKNGDPDARGRRGAPRAEADGYANGREYISRLETSAAATLRGSVAEFAETLLEAVDGAEDPEDIRHDVLAAYQGAPAPEAMRDTLDKSWQMAQRAGRVAVHEEA